MHLTSLEAMSLVIDALDSDSRFQDILDFAAKLERQEHADSGISQLTRLLLKYEKHEQIGRAAIAVGQGDFASRVFDDAIAAAAEPQTAQMQRCCKAVFLYKHARKEEAALELWEPLVPIFLGADNNSAINQYADAQRSMWECLTLVYFTKAMDAEKGGHEGGPEPYLNKLKRLARTPMSDSPKGSTTWKWISYGTTDASMMLGLWYRLHDRTKKAKAYFRGRILRGIEILSDDDPANDHDGYSYLASTLLIAGDVKNAKAAFSSAMAPLERQRLRRVNSMKTEETSPVASTTLQPEAEGADHTSSQKGSLAPIPFIDDETFSWACDGDCQRIAADYEEFYVCEYCPDTLSVCEECLPRLKAGKLPFKICNPTHPWHRIFPVDEEVKNLATFRANGRTMPRKEWLDMLKKEWTA